MNAILSQSDFRNYMVDGYFIFRNLIPASAVESMHEKLIAMVEASKGLGIEKVEKGKYHVDGRRGDGRHVEDASGIRKLSNFMHVERVFWENFCLNENVLTLNRVFLGEDTSVWWDSAFTKAPKIGEPTPWHQDIGLWIDAEPKVKAQPELVYDALNIWTAITRCDRENGCLQVIPGSHRTPIIPHVQYPGIVHQEIPRQLLEGHKPVFIELEPGDALIWNSLLWHHSPKNESDKKRWGIAMVDVRTSSLENITSGSTHNPEIKIRKLLEKNKPAQFKAKE